MPFNIMKKLIGKKPVEIEEISGKEIILLKLMGFGKPELTHDINRYLWVIDSDYVDSLIILRVQNNFNRFPGWIKKTKKKDDFLDKLMYQYVEKGYITQRDYEEHYDILRKYVENDTKTFLKEIGAEERIYKKLKIDLDKEVKQVGLNSFFG